MATLFALSKQEQAATGWTHQLHVSVADGDLDAASEVLDVMALEDKDIVENVTVHVITAWSGGTTEDMDIGITTTGAASTSLLSGATITNDDTKLGTARDAASGSSEFLTINRGGTGTSTAGEAYIYFRLIRPTDHANSV